VTQEEVALFVVASAVIAIVPGPDILYLVGRGVAQGRRAGVASALGLNVGALVHAALAAFGVSILILKFAPLFYVVKFAGAAYLGYLGLRMILDRSRLSVEGPDLAAVSLRRVFGESVVTDLLNPKVYLFFVSFLPQFVDPDGDRVVTTMLLLGGLFVLVNLPVDLTIALLAGRLGELFARRPSLADHVRWVAGGILVALGLRVAIADGG
jgi:threonine/homoserine/homoserine lactone efflux protein